MRTEYINKVDHFAQLLGVQFMKRSFKEASCYLYVRDEHCNALGGLHGGLIFSLADVAFAAACNSSDDTYIGIQAEIRYMRGGEGNELHAKAELIGESKRFAHYQVLVSDGAGNRVALFTSSAYRLSQSVSRE